MPILMTLAERFPDLRLDLSLTDRFADLSEERYDLAIRTGHAGNQAGIIGRRIARQKMIVCAAPGYLDASGRPNTIDDVKQHYGVVYRRSGAVPPWQFAGDNAAPVEVLPQVRALMDDLAAIADAVANGAGLACLPSWLIRERLEAGQLIELLPERSGFPYDVSALWLSAHTALPKVRLAIDALVNELPAYMGK
jgi:DNA-binding transcriptional LysR family regulator